MKKVLLIAFMTLFLPLSFAGASSPSDAMFQMQQILSREIHVLKNLMTSYGNATGNLSKVTAKEYIAVDLNTNQVLLAKNDTKPYPIASITKLMNVVVAAENINPEKKIAISSAMLKPDGHSPAIYTGLVISAKNLMEAALTQSVNDAAESLSYFLGNKTYIEKMNQKAKDLGMNSTVYVDANGLNPKNKSTADDLAKLLTYVYKNHPDLLTITRDNNFWLPDKTGMPLKFFNENYFYYLSEFIGGKTGFLPEANQTLAGVFTIKDRPVAIILLNSKNTFGDTSQIIKKLEK